MLLEAIDRLSPTHIWRQRLPGRGPATVNARSLKVWRRVTGTTSSVEDANCRRQCASMLATGKYQLGQNVLPHREGYGEPKRTACIGT